MNPSRKMLPYLFSLSFLFLVSCSTTGRTASEQTPEQLCFSEGGTWQTFPDGCADSCFKARSEDIVCTMSFTDSCDCGDKCWNGKFCEVV